MACEQFRFLIQQQFDIELPAQDENELSAHLSQCEACERFHFQIDQIVRTAADLDLPDDTTPENLESLARIIIQQMPKPKGGPLSFLTNLFAGKKQAAAKEPPKASHTPKNSSRFPHVRRNQSTTNQDALPNESQEYAAPHIEDHSQSMSTTLGGRFGRAHDTPAEPEGPLTLADTIRRKMQEEKQPTSTPAAESASTAIPSTTVWPSANAPAMPPGQEQSFPPSSNFQEDNQYAPAGGAWEEPAWSQQPATPAAPTEPPAPSPLASIDLMGQTGDTSNAWSNSATNVPSAPNHPSAPNDLELGLWQAQQDQSSKAWSEEAEQLETGFWQAFSPEQESGLSGPGGQLPAAQTPPSPAPIAPPPVPMSSSPAPIAPPPAPMSVPPAPIPIAQAPAAKQEDVVISRFDIPIQERLAGNIAPTPPTPTPAPPPIPETVWPAAPEPVATDKTSEPKSIMSRLSSILGDTPEQASTPQLMSEQNVAAMEQSTNIPVNMAPPPPPLPVPAPSAEAPQVQAPSPQPVPVHAAQTQPAAQAPAPNPSGLFNVDERTIDKIFSENLGIVDAGTAVNPGQQLVTNQAVQAPIAPPASPAQAIPQAPVPPAPVIPQSAPQAPAPPMQQAPAPAAPPQPAKQPSAPQGLFADMDDAAIDQLFSSNLGISEPAATQPSQLSSPAIPQPTPPAPPLPAPAPQVIPPPPPAPVQEHVITPPIAEPVAEPIAAEIPQPAVQPPEPIAVEPQPVATQPAAIIPEPLIPPPQPIEVPVAMSQPSPQAPPPQPTQGEGMLNVTESDLDKLFSENLGVSESALSAAPKVNLTQAVETIRQATESTQALPPPKIEGVGRLSKNVDNTQDTSSGKISSIGKFLLDQKDLAKLGKVASASLSSTDMRVLTMEAAQELQNLLGHIGSQPGVAGSVIVGHDGILIANNLPPGHDAESVGVWALGIFLNTENTIKMLGHNHVFQMVARTPQGFLVIADFGGGILVTVSQSNQTNELIPLMRTITQLVAQTAH